MDPTSSGPLPDRPDLEFERKRAKALLKAARAGDPDALARLGGADAALADAQLAIAQDRGFASWPKLKAHIESQRPLEEQVLPFLAAAQDRDAGAVRRMLARHPGLAQHDLYTASAAGDPDGVAAWIARDPGAVAAPHPATRVPAVVYAAGSPMHRTGRAGAANVLECVRRLLDAGASPNSSVPFEADEEPLPVLFSACAGGNAAVARLLLERGAEVDDGESIHHAAEGGHLECLEVLREFGVDLDARGSRWNKTVLYFLAEIESDPRGFAWLLDHGADPDLPSLEERETPLHRVARTGRLELADLLIRAGAGLDLPRADGRTAYVLAIRSGNRELADRLAAAGAKTAGLTAADEVLAACLRGDEAGARAALAAGGLTTPFPDADEREFSHAAARGLTTAVRVMARIGFDLTRDDPEYGPPLHAAAWWGRPETVRELLRLGAPVDLIEGRFGGTPIGWAAHGSSNCRSADADYLGVVDALIDAGASRPASVLPEGLRPSDAASRAVAVRLREKGY